MVSGDTDVDELLKLVIKSGVQLDEQLTQLQNMSEVVQKGIEQAQGELQKESEDAIWQEGILRHVPLVGSFYNWISPLQKPQIKGRCLSLNGGKLESTDKIFKKKLAEIERDEKEAQIPNGIDNPALTNDTAQDEENETKNEEQPQQQPQKPQPANPVEEAGGDEVQV